MLHTSPIKRHITSIILELKTKSKPKRMAIDYYNNLKVTRTLSDEGLKKDYKKLAMKWHPKNNIDNKLAKSKF
ncbi:putative DnaJ domain, Chaperone J-domain superfamily [Helianthus anomalus]